MTRHHIRPSRQTAAGQGSAGLGPWVVIAAFLLPLAAILAVAWLGADAVIAQARAYADQDLRAEGDLLAARVNGELLEIISTLESAALHGWDDSSTHHDIEALQSKALYGLDEAPAKAAHARAVRQARAVGSALVVDEGSSPMLVLAVADHPDRPARIAMAEISPDELLGAVPRREPLGEAALLDRAHHALHGNTAGQAWTNSSDSLSAARPESMLRTIRPLRDFPIYVGLARPEPDGWSLLMQNGRSLLVGAGLCLVLVPAGFLVLTTLVRRRLVEADAKRSLAFQEMEHVQKLSSIGRLAAGVAHEINNPLAIIAEKAGLMKDLASAAKDMPKAQRFIGLNDSILQAVTRCRAVTHRLLGFARRMEVRPMELDVNDVLRETLGFLERDALYRGITLDQELDEDLPAIESDRGQLQQVFLNLLNNAMAAVSDKGRIRVSTRREPDGVAVEIEDNGVGMSRETLAHIFEPFFSTKGEQGTGLGLSITYGIVDKLGGSIEVDSAEGEGSLFTIHLPLRANIAETVGTQINGG
ncbi:hypothetical protein DPQ33_07220 [Oceanidesulfovibrio indonesiensis]|uniref:histidine kinase n=1 Tax=Oceanidesulfovibrio indonesiensis TaxID=54767 RepID=A0A7M3MGK8_9BACT|nr:ATP-binding protein [Oceanidesulfovibrio indonesiensis]TVM17893.1 hypothetical protein DPQ33_07220 [Oceanidesulfovibrio indonesiensis]